MTLVGGPIAGLDVVEKRQFSCPSVVRTPDHSARTLIPIPTTPSRFPHFLHRVLYFPDFSRSLNRIIETLFFGTVGGGGIGIIDIGEIMGMTGGGVVINGYTLQGGF